MHPIPSFQGHLPREEKLLTLVGLGFGPRLTNYRIQALPIRKFFYHKDKTNWEYSFQFK